MAAPTTQPETLLRAIGAGPDHPINVAAAALALSALDDTRTDMTPYSQHLNDVAAAVGRKMVRTVEDAHGALRAVLADDHGYVGDDQTYDDLQNANLMHVIDRRKGLPVALGILYIDAARAQGWTIEGLGFPGHFLLRLDWNGERVVLDPFHGGVERTPSDLRMLLQTVQGAGAELRPEHYESVTDREILLRLQNNIKLRQMQKGDSARAATVIEHMMLIAPGLLELWRELGLVRANAGAIKGAITALEHYQDAAATRNNDVAAILGRLRQQLN
ncbi:MAG: tetratricopeptide repeat protein [Rhodospirillaceae bacterium]|jgi:regulator of sirC expression with transglutaminase-like and TPR domain|nr:tetratricopeptide repeat protein [Rhodospirillaceae bacterium]MBT5665145.1 tetratricopeptide repeat protein [Rhodospirillaceae bacterium]MBT5809624.1 tetratricopeptide repeat protein [Rhodospirillaceae bacterium]